MFFFLYFDEFLVLTELIYFNLKKYRVKKTKQRELPLVFV